MFILYANKNKLTVQKSEMVTSGSVNIYEAHFGFSKDWEGLQKTAVFRAGAETVYVLLGADGNCVIPWEVLKEPGYRLTAGVCGFSAGDIVLPTIWASLGTVIKGASTQNAAPPSTPELWEQELDTKGDNLTYDGLNLALRSGERILSQVQIVSGGEGSGPVYNFGHGLKQDGLNVSVNAVSDFSGDNTLPMTAAGVQATVGNIEALLGTI